MSLERADLEKMLNIIKVYESKIDLSIKIPLKEYEERNRKVWEEMKKRSIDLGFFFWYREMPGDGIYLTGYNPTIERASGFIAPNKGPLLLAGPESGILSKEVGLDIETYYVEEFGISDEYYEGLVYGSIKDLISNYVGDGIKTIGLMTADDYIPHRFVHFLSNGINPDISVINASDILADLRYEKSENEIKCMQQANVIACAALRSMLCVIRPGMRETEVAAVGDLTIKALGGIGYGFETIVTSGDRCRTVIGPATNKIIKENELVQFGCSPSYEGYKGISRRAVVAGRRNEIQNKYFQLMNAGYEIAVNELKNVVENSLPNNRIDVIPREYFGQKEIDGHNMKQFHFYSTCHGTGLTECLEPLVIHPLIEKFYGNNVGIMLDLGLYGHPNVDICGGCVEDAYFKKGKEVIKFSDLPVDVQELVGKGL